MADENLGFSICMGSGSRIDLVVTKQLTARQFEMLRNLVELQRDVLIATPEPVPTEIDPDKAEEPE